MTYIKINGKEYPAVVSGKLDRAWDGREVKVIDLAMAHETAESLFVDGIAWSVIFPGVEIIDENGSPTVTEPVEYDNSEYCLAGPITDHRDGTLTVLMGRPTLEELQAEIIDILTGGMAV